jgi:hypothetical protein
MRYRPRPIILSLALATALTAGCERPDESPFESHGVRAGMRFSELDRRTRPEASEWKREPMFFGVLSMSRSKRLHPTREKLRWATFMVTVDTADDRVYEVVVAPHMTDSLFDVDMQALAARWDGITNGRRRQTGQRPGPFFITWQSADTLWSGRIYYYARSDGSSRAGSFASVDNTWGDRVFRRIKAAAEAKAAELRRADSLARTRVRR